LVNRQVSAINNLYHGKDIFDEYEVLEPTKKLVACMIACSRLATHLDQSAPSEPPPALRHVGRFLDKVSYENVLVAIRSQIQIARIVKFTLDDHPDWSMVLKRVGETVDG
jgi:hypothetical protein